MPSLAPAVGAAPSVAPSALLPPTTTSHGGGMSAKRSRLDAEGAAAGDMPFIDVMETSSSADARTQLLQLEVERLKRLLAEREEAHKNEIKVLTEQMRDARSREETVTRMFSTTIRMDPQQQHLAFHQLAQQARFSQSYAGGGGKKGKAAVQALLPHMMHPFAPSPAMQYPPVSYQTASTGQTVAPAAAVGGPSYGGARLAHTATEDEARFLQEAAKADAILQATGWTHSVMKDLARALSRGVLAPTCFEAQHLASLSRNVWKSSNAWRFSEVEKDALAFMRSRGSAMTALDALRGPSRQSKKKNKTPQPRGSWQTAPTVKAEDVIMFIPGDKVLKQHWEETGGRGPFDRHQNSRPSADCAGNGQLPVQGGGGAAQPHHTLPGHEVQQAPPAPDAHGGLRAAAEDSLHHHHVS